MSVSARVAQEVGVKLGHEVGLSPQTSHMQLVQQGLHDFASFWVPVLLLLLLKLF